MEYYFDIETNALDNPTELWCVVFKDRESGEIIRCYGPSIRQQVIDIVSTGTLFIGHNCIEYDCKWLEKLLGISVFNEDNVLDTLVLSRLLWVKRPGGHSLEAWGERLKFPKGDFTDFSKYSDDMLKYCENDVELTAKVYDRLLSKMGSERWNDAIDIEHRIAWIARNMHEVGFYFDIAQANAMLDEVTARTQELYNLMVDSFPPVEKRTQLKTKEKIELIPFNPASPKQVVQRLNEFGWKPVDKTKGHLDAEKTKSEKLGYFKEYGWKVNERNLKTVPDGAPDACKLLVEWLLVDARRSTLTEWISVYNAETGCIHGDFNPLGTKTQRWVHSKPNMGNVPTAKTIKYNSEHLRQLAVDYGQRMRSLWCCPPGTSLIGVDMESAHLRIFGHLINDKDFIDALLNGNKANATDPHSLNKRLIGDMCPDRDRAKTFIFTYLNGGGAKKVGEIFNVSSRDGSKALAKFVESYAGLKKLKQDVIPKDAARGYCEGVDGRFIMCDSEHHMMGVYLQSAESILMKYSIVLMRDILSQVLDKLGINYYIVNTVHDEVVIQVDTEDTNLLEDLGKKCAECITQVGERFQYNCRLDGEYKIGRNWYEIH